MSSKAKIIIAAVILTIIIGSLTAVQIFIFGGFKKEKQSNQTATMTALDSEQNKKTDVRQPAVAGQFYPGDSRELGKIIDGYLAEVEIEEYEGVPQILVVPHAGYIYSGRVAAYAFKSLKNTGFKRVILIGRSHRALFDGVAADTHDIWSMPLGEVEVDKEFIGAIKDISDVLISDAKPHDSEHSLEVEIPFLIKTLGKDIRIVPLLFGNDEQRTIEDLAAVLEKTIDQGTLIVISSDLSHYPKYEDALGLDKATISAVLTGNFFGFRNKIKELENLNRAEVVTLACAEPAIGAALILAKNLGLKPHLLKYANSGDYFPEMKNNVVGYAAVVFNNTHLNELAREDLSKRELNTKEQKASLEISRKTLEAAFRNENYNYEQVVADYPIFFNKRGAFVTLKKYGQLRGCIGSFEPDKSLIEVIREMTLAAAFNDPRFIPLAGYELEEADIEISVLSPREKISDPAVIEIGKHGVYIQRGKKSGVFLPQVAVEQGWGKETFLNSLCAEKAGLEKDCWKDKSTDLYIFTAQVFGEKEI